MNPQSMTMVVARYNENIGWLKDVSLNYTVFNKGSESLPEWVKNEVKLPNVGREAHTYLTFIINNYDALPDFTIFVQGNPFDHSINFIKRLSRFNGRHDFFILTDKLNGRQKSGKFTHAERKVSSSARKIFIDELDSFLFPKGAQFIVSKKAILFHSKLTYQKIMDFMLEEVSPDDICLHMRKAHCPRNCEYRRPFSPWVLERLWMSLFNNKHKTIYDKR